MPKKKAPAKKKPAKKKPAKAFSELAIKRVIKAVGRGSTKELASALDRGLDPNVEHPKYRSLLLTDAIRSGNYAAAKLLLDAGANPKGRGSYGYTPLHYAVKRAEARELVEQLLALGADAKAKDKGGRTPMHDCAPELMPILIEAGADVNAKDGEGRTPYAAGDVAQRAALLEHGAEGFDGPGGRKLKPKVKKNPNLSEIYRTECIGKAPDGAIWLGSYAGYHRFADDGVTQYTFAESFSPDGFACGRDGAIYFSTNWGLLELKDGDWTIYEPKNCEIHDGHIVEIAADAEGRIHCLAYDNPHVSIFDGESWSLLRPGEDLPPEDFEIETIGFDADDNMLVGSDGDGALRREGKKWKDLPLHDEALGTPAVYDFAVMDGALYIGCLNGIVRIEGKKKAKHLEPEGVSLVQALAPAGDGVLWASGGYDGLMRLEDDELTYFTEDDQPFLGRSVEGLVVADDGRLWMHDGSTVLIFDGDEITTADGKSFEEARPEEAARWAKKKAEEAKKKAEEKKSKHVKG